MCVRARACVCFDTFLCFLFAQAYAYTLGRLSVVAIYGPPARLEFAFLAYWLALHVYVFNRVAFSLLTMFNLLAEARYGFPFTRYCHYRCCMVPGTQEGGRGGTIHCAILFVGKIQGSEIKKVFRGKNRTD